MSLLCYYAVQQIALGDAMALVFSAPLFTLFLEWVFINYRRQEPQGMLIKLPSAVLLLVGVVLILQPPFLIQVAGEVKKSNITSG